MPKKSIVPVLKKEDLKKDDLKNRSGRKLLYVVIALFITVLIILFFQSSLSKIAIIEITGNELIPNSMIGQAAKLAVGDHFFSLSSRTLESELEKLPSIESVKVLKKFPGVIKIQVKEFARVAFQLAEDGTKEALLADCSVVKVVGFSVPFDRPLLTSWRQDDPWKGKLCKVLGDVSPELLSDISEIKPIPTTAYEDKIKIYTRSKFEIITTVSYLPKKIDYFSFFINEMIESNKTSGVITLLETDRGDVFERQKETPKSSPTPSGKESVSPKVKNL